MIDVLIVDDQNMLDIIDCIQLEGSILKDKCKIVEAYFATTIPKGAQIIYKEKDTAISKINAAKNIDIAFLDISFPKEVTGKEDYYEPLLALIAALHDKHPHCQLLILSQHHTEPFFKEKLQIGNTDIFLPSIPKSYKISTLEEYNKAFTFLLTNRLKYILNECTHDQKKMIKDFLTDKSEKAHKTEFVAGSRSYNQNSLLFEFLSDKNIINKNAALEKYLTLIIDAPKMGYNHWSKKSSVYAYGLKDYYFQYHKFYAAKKEFSVETLQENAYETMRLLFDFLFKNESITEVNALFFKFPAYKLRTKFELQKYENGRIPDLDMLKFNDFLLKRLLTLGLYFGANASCTGINYLLQKNSYCNNSQDVNRQYITYMLFSLQDQISTEIDLKISTLDGIGAILPDFEDGDKTRQPIKLLGPMERRYDKIYNDLANYEKYFVKEICNYSRKISTADSVNEHLDHILESVIN